ncbi:MAG: VWA domain-containing protein [Pseudomonadota bacterium]
MHKLPKTLIGMALMLLASGALSQGSDDEDDLVVQEIVVTGAKVTGGGAQDIDFARSEIAAGRIPHPTSFTDEGLLSQHDLTLPGSSRCAQLFCLISEAAPTESVSKPDDQFIVGLGFATNIDASELTERRRSIVAVVDKSGSMSGTPLGLVRTSLAAMVDALRSDDQLAIVLYGDRSHVYLEPTLLTRDNRSRVKMLIRDIESAGSTNMEEGLAVGFATARRAAQTFDGTHRVILFTDERPNVGDTSADGFISMAKAASNDDIGLTTIGVGVQFDSKLAVRLSSTRGGNLFFLPDKKAARTLFDKELDTMVAELAHDLEFTVRPDPEFDITGVYGVPDELLAWSEDRAVSFKIATVFLSTRGGGVFVTLARRVERANMPLPRETATQSLLSATIKYTPATDARAADETHAVVVKYDERKKSSRAIRTADILIDEYVSLREATSAHYLRNDQKAAFAAIDDLRQRFETVKDRRVRRALAKERRVVGILRQQFAFLAGYASEGTRPPEAALWGEWLVKSVSGDDLDEAPQAGDRFVFTPAGQLVVLPRDQDEELDLYSATQRFFVDGNQLYLEDSDVVFVYELSSDSMRLVLDDDIYDESVELALSLVSTTMPEAIAPIDSPDWDDQ